MPELSVLMSVYNETPEEMEAAVRSVLTQSFPDFELILVNDRPDDPDQQARLERYAQEDARVRLLVNERNIGLAQSLNAGAKRAVAPYLVRMDADDISMPDRFEKQYEAIFDLNADLLCTRYQVIDESGAVGGPPSPFYTGRQIESLLPYQNVIHHPTVMMKRSAFDAAGGYRPYPCAQDYDLWLRMRSGGCAMRMLDEALLFYRMRRSSVSLSRKLLQLSTLDYIRSNYRRAGGLMPEFDETDYLAHVKLAGVGNPDAERRFGEAKTMSSRAKEDARAKRFAGAAMLYLRAMGCSPFYRRTVLGRLRYLYVLKTRAF